MGGLQGSVGGIRDLLGFVKGLSGVVRVRRGSIGGCWRYVWGSQQVGQSVVHCNSKIFSATIGLKDFFK